jgi:hypothetical protein
MTLEQLKDIFKNQLTASETYTPKSTVEYMVIDPLEQSKLIKEHAVDNLDTLLTELSGFELDAYRDRMPIFIRPEIQIAL